MKRGLSAAFTAVCLVGFGPAGLANADTNGQALCMNSDEVVGVWVAVQGGSSGWARRTGQGHAQGWHYDTQGKPYELHVGCGGSPAHWKATTTTFGYQRNWSVVDCYPEPKEQYGDGGTYAPIGKCVRG
jgi:hypothetical protein